MGAEGGLAFRRTEVNPFLLGKTLRTPEELARELTKMMGERPIAAVVTTIGRERIGAVRNEPVFFDAARKDLIELGGPDAEKMRKLISGYVSGDKTGKRAKEVVTALKAAYTRLINAGTTEMEIIEKSLARLAAVEKPVIQDAERLISAAKRAVEADRAPRGRLAAAALLVAAVTLALVALTSESKAEVPKRVGPKHDF